MPTPLVVSPPVHPPVSLLFVRGRSLGGPGLGAAIAMVERNPGLRVALFEAEWAGVDRSRMILAARGLDARISVHHRHAWAKVAGGGRTAA